MVDLSAAAPQSVERFGGLVNLNVHFHLLVPDGVFAETDAGLVFMLLPAPTGGDLLAILDRVMCRVARRLDREEPDGEASRASCASLPPGEIIEPLDRRSKKTSRLNKRQPLCSCLRCPRCTAQIARLLLFDGHMDATNKHADSRPRP